uniref:Uncharacterized protein n=1 Tax=Candidatus Kentrum sp. FM TaxID=2126340 RepID=A0A450RVE0_9GAMM|nr:MAG: hypothetical protein BECKFM1743A_GA0114220_1000416 [Candidatus Kentron sp. FM]VFJ43928.1 MAG: hypothetical protein BECKFM1743C_GA0114222_100063 [Candidatus Kentron sp. FM]VFK07346.1 MAG: hypothetical protein BECKFM1743B_GA0114221_100389 [Candidatus Kentron sp. FM]
MTRPGRAMARSGRAMARPDWAGTKKAILSIGRARPLPSRE